MIGYTHTHTHTFYVCVFVGLQQLVAVQTSVTFPPLASERRRPLKTTREKNISKDLKI